MAADLVARNSRAAELLLLKGSPHLALVFERFPRLLQREGQGFNIPGSARRDVPGGVRQGAPDGGRLVWLREFVGLAGETRERRQRLATVHARLDALAKEGLRREARTVWRLAIGLGNPSASEVGMTFDAACGVPCLPGSSVKGLARAGAELLDAPKQQVGELLGVGPKGTDAGAGGTVIFLDALPLYWPKFAIDIVTRHHDPEALPQQVVPLDTDKPNPVHFLTVAPDQIFVFRLLSTQHAHPESLQTAWQWLVTALDELGAGAKTAVGYGQMVEVSPGPS